MKRAWSIMEIIAIATPRRSQFRKLIRRLVFREALGRGCRACASRQLWGPLHRLRLSDREVTWANRAWRVPRPGVDHSPRQSSLLGGVETTISEVQIWINRPRSISVHVLLVQYLWPLVQGRAAQETVQIRLHKARSKVWVRAHLAWPNHLGQHLKWSFRRIG